VRPDLSVPRTIHLVGVGGAGMSGLARLALARGHKVSGSDAADTPVLAVLRALGADVWAGHDGARLGKPDLVVASTAIRHTNPELAAARELGIPVLRRVELLAALTQGRSVLAVAGTHGKTTTTTMVTQILVAAGLDPSYAVGGDPVVPGPEGGSSGLNAGFGAGPHFVAEADESDGSFLELDPTIAIVTNVEADHLDHWGDFSRLRLAFRDFVGRLPADGVAVLCADDPGSLALAPAAPCEVVTYGIDLAGAGWRAVEIEAGPAGSGCTIVHRGRELGRLELPRPGRHVLLNALGALAAASAAGAGFDAAVQALSAYAGVARRFQHRGEAGGVTVIDDYAHHPTEVAATIAEARLGGWDRIVAVFQPHLYSRTAAFGEQFGSALAGADVVVVADVYAAREDPLPGVSGELVAEAARAARPGLEIVYEPERAALAARTAALLRDGDLLLTLGAGDVTRLADEVLPLLGGQRPARGGAAGTGTAGTARGSGIAGGAG
jgi:UDP-N-acetylmuramate--alanine ligase